MHRYRSIKTINEEYWPTFLKNVFNYIEDNYSKKLYLDEIAEQANLSKCYFCRVFKILTGKTVFEYVNTTRIEKAKELLEVSFFNITEICFQVGFSDTSSFFRSFKKTTGKSPSEYRMIQIK